MAGVGIEPTTPSTVVCWLYHCAIAPWYKKKIKERLTLYCVLRISSLCSCLYWLCSRSSVFVELRTEKEKYIIFLTKISRLLMSNKVVISLPNILVQIKVSFTKASTIIISSTSNVLFRKSLYSVSKLVNTEEDNKFNQFLFRFQGFQEYENIQ